MGARVRLLAAAAAFILPTAAHAQPRAVDTPESLLLRAETDGVRTGNVIIFPRLDYDVTQDSNIFNLDNLEVDDAVLSVRPSVMVRPDLSRHEIVLTADAQFRRYFDIKSENSDQYSAGVRGRLDFAERTSFNGSLLYARRIEQRGSFGDQLLTDSPISFDAVEATAGLARVGGTLELRGGVNYSQQRYNDSSLGGVSVDMGIRDVDSMGGFVRSDYRVSPKVRSFVELAYDQTDYQLATPVPRDSDGYSALVGAHVEVSELIDAEAAVGFAHRSFDDPASKSFNGIDFRINGRWTPTPRWLFAAEGRRSFERSALLNVPAVLQTRLRVVAQRSLGRRMLVGVEGTYENWEYRDIDRSETRIGGEATVRYLVADYLTAFVGAGYRDQSGSGIDPREYSGSAFRIGMSVSI